MLGEPDRSMERKPPFRGGVDDPPDPPEPPEPPDGGGVNLGGVLAGVGSAAFVGGGVAALVGGEITGLVGGGVDGGTAGPRALKPTRPNRSAETSSSCRIGVAKASRFSPIPGCTITRRTCANGYP